MEFVLKLIEPSDARAIHDFFEENFLFLSPWVSGLEIPVMPEQTAQFVTDAIRDALDMKAVRLLILVAGEIAGIVSVIKIDAQQGSAELGYILGEKFTGRGLATQACKAVVELCFTDFNLNRIEIAVSETNLPSHFVAKRLGAVPEGIRRQGELIHGQFINQIVYSILKQEWIPIAA